jgi:hypothetical protein
MDRLIVHLTEFWQADPELFTRFGRRFFLAPPDASAVNHDNFLIFDNLAYTEITDGAGECAVTVRVVRKIPYPNDAAVTFLCNRIRTQAKSRVPHIMIDYLNYFFTEQISLRHYTENDYAVTTLTFMLSLQSAG